MYEILQYFLIKKLQFHSNNHVKVNLLPCWQSLQHKNLKLLWKRGSYNKIYKSCKNYKKYFIVAKHVCIYIYIYIWKTCGCMTPRKITPRNCFGSLNMNVILASGQNAKRPSFKFSFFLAKPMIEFVYFTCFYRRKSHSLKSIKALNHTGYCEYTLHLTPVCFPLNFAVIKINISGLAY